MLNKDSPHPFFPSLDSDVIVHHLSKLDIWAMTLLSGFRSRPCVPKTSSCAPVLKCLDICIDGTHFHHKVASNCISKGKSISDLVQLSAQVHFLYLTWVVDWNNAERRISHSWPLNKVSEIVYESESYPPDSRPVWRKYRPLFIGNAWRCKLLPSFSPIESSLSSWFRLFSGS